MEQLDFKLVLKGMYFPEIHDTPPHVDIMLGNKLVGSADIEDTETIDFTAECNQTERIRILFANKTYKDVVLGDDGMPIKDKGVLVQSLMIDGIDVTQLIDEHSEFHPTDHSVPTGVTYFGSNLSWPGHWEFTFNTPFYIWLLESM